MSKLSFTSLLRILALCCLSLLVFSLLLTVPLRWINPPVTAFILLAGDASASQMRQHWTPLDQIDPLVSLVIAAVILIGTWSLLTESLNLAVDAVPKNIDLHQVETALEQLPDVLDVHHLHVWALSTTETALTAHLVRRQAADDDALIHRASELLRQDFGIGHTTLQLEYQPQHCPTDDHC